MKRYQPLRISPNSRQFYDFFKTQPLSQDRSHTAAYCAVLHLFQTAEAIYKSLNHQTSEQLVVFTEAQQYLSSAQEHDLVSYTAHLVSSIDCELVRRIVRQDQTLSQADQKILEAAIDLFHQTDRQTADALGRPRWIIDR